MHDEIPPSVCHWAPAPHSVFPTTFASYIRTGKICWTITTSFIASFGRVTVRALDIPGRGSGHPTLMLWLRNR